MKKTLIALTLAATTLSSSAMALTWSQGGSGGEVTFSGTLTPTDKVVPWEVAVGDAVTGLDAQIETGSTNVTIKTSSPVPVLGIRSTDLFTGQTGIDPQIDFGSTVDVDGFVNGETTLTLDVKDDTQAVIGTLTAPFISYAELSFSVDGSSARFPLMASQSGKAFFGGLGKSSTAASSGLLSRITAISSEFTAKYDQQNATSLNSTAVNNEFSQTSRTYSAFYGSGIESGANLTIALSNEPDSGALVWSASLPVTVTYE